MPTAKQRWLAIGTMLAFAGATSLVVSTDSRDGRASASRPWSSQPGQHFVTIATAASAGTPSDVAGQPRWLPAGSNLVRHSIDGYGVHAWVYRLPDPSPSGADQLLLTIVAVSASTLEVPVADTNDGFQASATTVGTDPGQLLTHQPLGVERLDFLRGGIAFTLLTSRVAEASGDSYGLSSDDLATIADSVES